MDRKILITGGGGFIAPYLACALAKEGEVFMHIRQTSKTSTLDLPGVIYIRSSSLDDGVIRQSLPDGIDTVFHLAGAASSPNALAMANSNVVTTANVINLMADRGIPNLIFMSTAAVWRGALDSRINESTPEAPDTHYGYAKLAAESLIVDAVNRGFISAATILRCNGTYGYGGYQGVVINFYNRLRNCESVSIDGDGLQLREPLYVSDLVDLILCSSTQTNGLQVYAASGPQTLTVLDIARTIAKVLNRKLTIEWQPERNDRNRHIILSNSKAQEFLKWKPQIYLQDGLRMMISAELEQLTR